jgi:D-xylono/L-arabinono-1,4-lactonase
MQPRVIADYACEVGEGAIWHPAEACLYWLDIPKGRVFRYTPESNRSEIVYQGDIPIGAITIQSDGALAFYMGGGAVSIWRGGQLQPFITGIPELQDTRFNDVFADPRGRVFAGTMKSNTQAGKLYRIDPDGSYRILIDGLGTPNGMGFTPDQKGFYFTHTTARTVYLFDYDIDTGEITNQRPFFQLPQEDQARPDGLAVDAEGYVWSALWDGACVLRYSPDGTLDRRIDLPVKQTSCPAFGGADYTDLYITTAGGQNREQNGAEAGALFCVNLGIAGTPDFESRLGIL